MTATGLDPFLRAAGPSTWLLRDTAAVGGVAVVNEENPGKPSGPRCLSSMHNPFGASELLPATQEVCEIC
jgi:hypothetical protein